MRETLDTEGAAELRHHCVQRLAALDRARAGYCETWRALAPLFAPQRGPLADGSGTAGRGARRDGMLIDNTPLLAARTLASGMMAGISSPARPWFRLRLADTRLNGLPELGAWLETVEKRLAQVFARSNLYNCLHTLYGELGVFGTAALWIDEDEEDVVRGYALTAGEYWLASSRRLAVDTLYRTMWWSARQIVDTFGRDAVSPRILGSYDQGRFDELYEIVHAVEPDPEGPAFGFASLGFPSSGFPWRSAWFERAGGGDRPLLRRGGYAEFPCMAPRWEACGSETWGSGPGWVALGDALQLQSLQAAKAEAIEKQVRPPLIGPAGLEQAAGPLLPGSVTYVADPSGQGFRAAYDVRLDLSHLAADIAETQGRIRGAFYADLFLMMADSERSQVTAREIDERREEKMLMLGPVLERLHDELLDPLIRRVLAIMARNGLIPAPPGGYPASGLQIEFVSLLASAQKASATASLERFWQFGQAIARLKPEAIDRLDADGTLEAYADLTGVPHAALVPAERAAELRGLRVAAEGNHAPAGQLP